MKPRHLLLLFALLQLCVAFLTYGQTFTHEESMWHYIGRNWFRHGLVPYTGGVDNKSPLIFSVFGVSDLLFGLNYWFPRILGTAVQCAGIYFLYKIALRISSNDPINARQSAIITATLYGFSLLWRGTGGKYVSFTETYAVAFIIISVYQYIKGDRKSFLFSGLLAGFAMGWRISAVFGILAIVCYSVFKRRNALLPFAGGLAAACGMLLLLALVAGLDMEELYLHAFADNFGQGSTTDHGFTWQMESFINGFFYSELILFYPALAAYFLMKKQYGLVTLWLLFEFIGINALGIYARPHFKHLLPALSLASGISIAYFVNRYALPFRQVMIVVWIIFFPKVIEPLISLKKLFVPPPDTLAKYCAPPYPRTDEQAEKQLGLWIRDHTKPGNYVLVAGYGARVQLYSNRLSPSIYFNVTQTSRAKQRFMQDVNLHKPHLVAVPLFREYSIHVGSDLRTFIDELMRKEYVLERCMYGYAIYRLRVVG